MSHNPESVTLTLKLLEVYFIAENASAFLKVAQAHQNLLTDAGKWKTVATMGQHLCSDDPLFVNED
jgi:hypothetical protein